MNERPRVWAEIDLDALEHNVGVLRSLLRGGTRIMAVLKADAYGIGAVAAARRLQLLGIDAFGVGNSTEALELRRAGVRGVVLILGAIVPGEVESVVREDVSVCIHSEDRVDSLVQECRRQRRTCRVHLKVDTGMGRLGVRPHRALELARRIASERELVFEGVATHLAGTAWGPDPGNGRQVAEFAEVRRAVLAEGLGAPLFHAAASAGIFSDLDAEFDMVRPGLALWGSAPRVRPAPARGLRPVLSLRSQVIFLKDVPAGTTIGYGRRHTCEAATRIATIPVGYNDGLPTRLRRGGRALVRGQEARLVGAISMDYATLDVGPVPGVRVGDPVTLIGKDGERSISLEQVASVAGTIPHEVLCSIGKRVERVYRSSAVEPGRAAVAR